MVLVIVESGISGEEGPGDGRGLCSVLKSSLGSLECRSVQGLQCSFLKENHLKVSLLPGPMSLDLLVSVASDDELSGIAWRRPIDLRAR
jgi:hypothetical protein